MLYVGIHIHTRNISDMISHLDLMLFEGSRLRVQGEEGLGFRPIWSGLGFAVSGGRTSRRAETCKAIGLCGLVALCV